jgi:serine/threonine protein phosphatase PrpC
VTFRGGEPPVSDPFPLVEPVRVRGTGATHAGPRREHDGDAFGFFEDSNAALAVVADGVGSAGDEASRRVIETCSNMFRGRRATILDDLAETWWRNEHGEPRRGDARVRPFSTLPIAERVELRERVRLLLDRRVPETMGDVAVLEAETQMLLGIGAQALARVNGDIHRLVERERARWHDVGACAACVTFAAGRVSIAHVGDCRVSRVRGASIELLTTDHTLHHDATQLPPEQRPTPEELERVAPNVLQNILTRLLGAKDKVQVDELTAPLEAGDLFLVATDGLWQAFSETELLTALRSRRTAAAAYLIERAPRHRPGQPGEHPGDNLTAVVVEVV